MKNKFTLIEMVIAASIVGLAAVVLFEMVSSSLIKTGEIESDWGRQHLLSLASEYYLLAGDKAPAPQELLPQGYSAQCSIKFDSTSEIQKTNLLLATYTIELYCGGELIGAQNIKKILPKEVAQ